MKDLLIQQGLDKTLDEKKPESMKPEGWVDIDKDSSAINLSDEVLNNVSDEDIVHGI